MNSPKPELRFKLDENMPREAGRMLDTVGFEAFSVFDEHLEGTEDSVVIAACKEEELVIITCDLHFSDIRAYPPAEFQGIIILRPRRQGRSSILKLLADLIPQFDKTILSGKLWIVSESSIRIREG